MTKQPKEGKGGVAEETDCEVLQKKNKLEATRH